MLRLHLRSLQWSYAERRKHSLHFFLSEAQDAFICPKMGEKNKQKKH